MLRWQQPESIKPWTSEVEVWRSRLWFDAPLSQTSGVREAFCSAPYCYLCWSCCMVCWISFIVTFV